MTKINKFVVIPLIGVTMLGAGAVAGYATLAGAQTTTNNNTPHSFMSGMSRYRTPHIDGTITAINGSTITITGDTDDNSGGTYTIDAANASVTKDGAASSLASLATGDKIFVEGTVNGTNVTATTIMSGNKGFGHGGPEGHRGRGPGLMGKVTAVNGSTITITSPNGTSYTVNAGSATIQKMVTGSLSDVAVGDNIGIKGTVSGTSVTATNITDGLPPSTATPQQ